MVVKKYYSYYYQQTMLGFYFYGRREELMCFGRDACTIKLPSLSAYNVKQ